MRASSIVYYSGENDAFEACSHKISQEYFPQMNSLRMGPTSPGSSRNSAPASPPLLLHDTRVLQQAAVRMQKEARKPNTAKAYEPKAKEFVNYLEAVWTSDGPEGRYTQTLDGDKVFLFTFYQAFREKKQQGGGRSRNPAGFFDHDDYQNVLSRYRSYIEAFNQGNVSEDCPQPADPIDFQAMTQYKAAIKWVHEDDKLNGASNLAWEFVWTPSSQALLRHVQRRRASVRKRRYQEKITEDMAPYMMVKKYPKMEEVMWLKGSGHCNRTGFMWIRTRFILLFTTAAILRCESLWKAELSDFMGIYHKTDKDYQELFAVVMGITTGKF